MVTTPTVEVRRLAIACATILLTVAGQSLHAQSAPPAGAPEATRAKAIPIADYARWRSIQGATISANGEWVAWSYAQVRRDDVLNVRNITTGKEHTVERASRPAFSDDGRWIAYSVAPPIKEVDKLTADKKPVLRRAELMNLETGEKVGWDAANSFEFAKGSSHLAVKKERPEPKPKHEGADLILRNLRTNSDELVGSVAWHSFNKPGSLLAYATDAADMDGNGLYLIDLGSGVRRALDNAREKYTRATWSENGSALAALRGVDADTLEQRVNRLLAFTNLSAPQPNRVEIAPGTEGLPANQVISDKGTVTWSESADRVFFGMKQQAIKPKKTDREDWQKPSDVDVFHWNDDRIQSVQAKQVEADRNRADRAVLHVATRKVVTLTDGTLRNITLTRDGRWGVATDDRAYVSDWEEARADYYRVDVSTGARTPMLQAHKRVLGVSPAGTHYLYWKDDHVWAYELATNKHVNITAKAPVSFVNKEWDYLSSKPAYGLSGWTKDGKGVILDHRYDLWYVPLDGSAPRVLTNGIGSEHEMRLRYARLDPEELFIDLAKPVLLSAYGQWTKKVRLLRAAQRSYTRAGLHGQQLWRCAEGTEGRSLAVHAAELDRIPRSAGVGARLCATDESDQRKPAAVGVRVGSPHPVRLHEQRRRAAAGHAGDSGGLPAGSTPADDRAVL